MGTISEFIFECQMTLTFHYCFHSRSLPKLSSQDEEGGAGHPFGGGLNHFEPIPHDHDFCERVVINVSDNWNLIPLKTAASGCLF